MAPDWLTDAPAVAPVTKRKLGRAFGMSIAYTSRNPRPEAPYPYFASAAALAAEVDFLVVITPGGGESEAFLYEVEPRCREPFVPPHPDYLDAVRRGYDAHGLEVEPLDEAAAGRLAAGSIATLFVYGTLRRGELRHPILERHRGRLLGEGRIEGTLLDLGPHPALIGLPRERPVIGEIYAFDDLAKLLHETDRVEGFLGFGDPSSLYRRGVVSASLGDDGPPMMAWTYLFAGDAAGLPVVSGGVWRREHIT